MSKEITKNCIKITLISPWTLDTLSIKSFSFNLIRLNVWG